MMFAKPINILTIQRDLVEYRKLCDEFNHSPAQKEFKDILDFLLLYGGASTAGGTMTESFSDRDMKYLYENFIHKLNISNVNESEIILEGKPLETDGEAEFDTAVGTAKTAVVATAALGIAGVVGAGIWIAYMMKKGKVKGAVKQETAAAMEPLNAYKEIYLKKVEKAKLEGKTIPKGDPPGFPQGTEPRSEPSSDK
tara:strand:- start:452 stop:1042 length:591 start_codon:yes stop_codon:yes gene_type:complete